MIIWCILGLILFIISINDFLFFRIEDENIQALLILYFVSYITGISGNNFILGISTAVVVFVITLILNRFDLMGGGDVKLLFPLILFAENYLYEFLIGTSLAGLVLSITYIAYGNKIFFFRKKMINRLYILRKNKKKFALLNIVLLSLYRISKRSIGLRPCTTNTIKQEIPYGVALACGEFYVIIENLLFR